MHLFTDSQIPVCYQIKGSFYTLLRNKGKNDKKLLDRDQGLQGRLLVTFLINFPLVIWLSCCKHTTYQLPEDAASLAFGTTFNTKLRVRVYIHVHTQTFPF